MLCGGGLGLQALCLGGAGLLPRATAPWALLCEDLVLAQRWDSHPDVARPGHCPLPSGHSGRQPGMGGRKLQPHPGRPAGVEVGEWQQLMKTGFHPAGRDT